MAQPTDAALAILGALAETHSAGRTPAAIVLDDATRESLQQAGLGYWSAGPATWSLFNVPVVMGEMPGWSLALTCSKRIATSAPGERPAQPLHAQACQEDPAHHVDAAVGRATVRKGPASKR